MSQELLQNLIKQSNDLTSEELFQLVSHLTAKAQRARLANSSCRKLSEFKGRAPYPLVSEDAQTWISRTRQEDTEQREKLLRHDKS
ncbi:DUF2281 domain-containing protein [Tumidithrix helvetica PCC 7403]|uniref:hypothetical protein n=1 Tax=Tumidithrix helvetica TaxID=3457545 RepID=UPI003CB33FAE